MRRTARKAKWTYQNTDLIEGYDDPISKTQSEMIDSMNIFIIIKKK